MVVRDLVYLCQYVCVSQSQPMAVTSPVDIELCAVAVYQSKAQFNEGAKKPIHTYIHTCIYTPRHAQTVPEGCFSAACV